MPKDAVTIKSAGGFEWSITALGANVEFDPPVSETQFDRFDAPGRFDIIEDGDCAFIQYDGRTKTFNAGGNIGDVAKWTRRVESLAEEAFGEKKRVVKHTDMRCFGSCDGFTIPFDFKRWKRNGFTLKELGESVEITLPNGKGSFNRRGNHVLIFDVPLAELEESIAKLEGGVS